MHDAFFVRCRQPVRDLHSVIDRPAQRYLPAPDPLAQRLAFEQLCHHVRHTLVRPHLVHGKNVGMIQRRRRAGFLLKAPQPVGIGRDGLGQNLDRDFAVQPRVVRTINLTHSARAQR